MSSTRTVLVIGGGLTGLAAGVALQARGARVRVLEAGTRAGGVVTTYVKDGWRVELGPNSVARVPQEVEALFVRAGIASRVVGASAAARHRFIVRGGRPVALPASPADLPSTAALSGAAKLRLLREPFIPPAPASLDESVAAFARRRLGDEVCDYLVNPFVAGVYAGDPEKLSLRAAFPKLHALEQEHGSLIKGLMKSMGKRGDGGAMPGGIWSLPDGLAGVGEALAKLLGDAFVTGVRVTAIRPRAGGGFRVEAQLGEQSVSEEADAVVYAAPAHAWAAMAERSPELAPALDGLRAVPHSAVAVMSLGFRRAQVAHPLDGFGLLVPAVERRRVLGILFPSSLFAGRAPEGHVLLTAFIGGARQPELAGLPPKELEALVLAEVRDLLGAEGPQAFGVAKHWASAIPQYAIGHDRLQASWAAAEAANPGLVIAGTFRDGIAVGDALAAGLKAADRALGADARVLTPA